MSAKPRSGGANNSALCWPTRKSWMARAKSAVSRSCANRCANGCSASPPTRKACWTTWTPSNGAIHSRKCSATGLAAAKERKWIFRLRTADCESGMGKISASSPPGPTRCSARLTWCCRRNTNSLTQSPRRSTAPGSRGISRRMSPSKSDLERTELAKEKTGVFTGAYAINPVNGEKIPIWIADYVLASYGTGAIMAVPAHDTRDFEFAHQIQSAHYSSRSAVRPEGNGLAAASSGTASSVNSTGPEISITGLPTPEAKKKITAWLEAKGLGKRTVNFKLRDWLFSRQRYWGEPFPIVWKKDAAGNLYHEALPESALPVLPPRIDRLQTHRDRRTAACPRQGLGEPARRFHARDQHHAAMGRFVLVLSPLSRCQKFDRLCQPGSRAILDGFCSGRLYRRHTPNIQRRSRRALQTARALIYTSAAPSTPSLHLLYARFWHKVLFDLGHVSTPEPFFKLVNQGLILGEDGQRCPNPAATS